MDIHKDARLTLFSREALAQKVLSRQLTPKPPANGCGATSSTAAAVSGIAPSRPHRSPRRTATVLVERVQALRRQRWTGMGISQATGLSRATVSRILRRLGLHCLRALEPAPPPVRYEYPVPGGLLHLDIKALGRFTRPSRSPDRPGRRRSNHAGWESLHVA